MFTLTVRDLTWSVVPVQNGQSEERSVTMGGEGGFGQRSQVVHVIETRPVRVIVARQQQVHVVRRLQQQVNRFCLMHAESNSYPTGKELDVLLGLQVSSGATIGSCSITKNYFCIQILTASFQLKVTSLEIYGYICVGGGGG